MRQKLFYGAIALCWLHVALYIGIDKAYELRDAILGGAALLIAAVFMVLHLTKRTLDVEREFPTWMYQAAAGVWSASAVFWFLGMGA